MAMSCCGPWCRHGCVAILAVALGVPFFGNRFLKDPKFTVDVSGRLDGRLAVVTGGSNGVGREVASLLAARGAEVIVTGRTVKRAEAAAPSGGAGLALNLADFTDVRRFAAELRARLEGRSLDILILNAGMAYGADYRGPYTTPEGHDTITASNHLGHFLLARELRPIIERSRTRMVIVASGAHWLVSAETVVGPQPVVPDGEVIPPLTGLEAYGNTKLMNVLFTYRLQRDLAASGASAVVCTPGFVKTSIGNPDRDSGASLPEFNFAKSARDGAEVMEAAATALDASALKGKMLQPYWIWEGLASLLPRVARSVQLMFQELAMQRWTWGLRAHASSPESYDEALQDRLWAWSEAAVTEAKA